MHTDLKNSEETTEIIPVDNNWHCMQYTSTSVV